MKELLQKRKAGFIRYIIACFIPVINHHLSNLAIALLIGSIEKASVEYFFKIIYISLGIVLFGSITKTCEKPNPLGMGWIAFF